MTTSLKRPSKTHSSSSWAINSRRISTIFSKTPSFTLYPRVRLLCPVFLSLFPQFRTMVVSVRMATWGGEGGFQHNHRSPKVGQPADNVHYLGPMPPAPGRPRMSGIAPNPWLHQQGHNKCWCGS